MVKDFLLNIFSTRDEYIDSLGKSPQIISQIATGIIAKYNLEKSIGTISGNDKLSSDLKKLMSCVVRLKIFMMVLVVLVISGENIPKLSEDQYT